MRFRFEPVCNLVCYKDFRKGIFGLPSERNQVQSLKNLRGVVPMMRLNCR
jgi:hypothetical protein